MAGFTFIDEDENATHAPVEQKIAPRGFVFDPEIKEPPLKAAPPPDEYGVGEASSLGRGMAKAIVGAPGIAGDIQYLARKAEPYIGITPPKHPLVNLPTSTDFIEKAKPYIPALQGNPETTPEKYAETIGEFAGFPGGIRGKVGGALDLPKILAKQVIIPGAASEAAGQVAEGTSLEPWARVAGAVAGGLPFGAKTAESLAKSAETAGAAARAGVDLPYFAYTPQTWPKMVANALKAVPIGASPIFEASKRSIGQIGAAAGDTFQQAGGRGIHEAGDIAKSGIVNWVKRKSADSVDRAYAAVDRAVDPAIKTPASNLANTLQAMQRENAAAALSPISPAMNLVMDAATHPQGLTYEGMRKLRTKIGEQLNNGILPADTSKAELKRIYGALSEDLKASAQNAGGQRGLEAFNRANNYNRLVSQRREQLAKIVGASGDAPAEQVLGRIESMAAAGTRGDIARLTAAKKIMPPDEWENVASGLIGKIGRDNAGNFSPERFITSYDKISEGGKNTLFGPAGSSVRRSLDDIRTLSDKFKELNSFSNPSGTARNLEGLGLIYAAMAQPFVAAGHIVGASLFAKILSNPVTAKKAAKLQRDYVSIMESGEDPARKEMAFKNAVRAYETSLHKDLGGDEVPERPRRASGGRTMAPKPQTAQSLLAAVKRARKAIQSQTEAILAQPDEHVVRALSVANEKI